MPKGTEVPLPPGVPANRCIINLTVSECPELQGQLQVSLEMRQMERVISRLEKQPQPMPMHLVRLG